MSLHHSPDKKYLTHFEKYDDTRIVFDDGALTQLSAELLLERIGDVCFIYGGHSAMKNGIYRDFIAMTSRLQITTQDISGIPAEPDTDDVRRIVEQLRSAEPSLVIAAGGGSVMDAAKAAYLSWQTGLDVTELFGVNVASSRFPGKEFKRIMCIPTTSGTGSEVTPYANIVDREKAVKCLIAEEQIVPSAAFVNPAYTASMPEELTVATAMDAMVHSIESFLNEKAAQKADPASDEWAADSVSMIRYALPRYRENPADPLARELLSAAAVLGGMCIKARPTSLPHLCSFSLYGTVPHGCAVAAFLPVFWRYYLQEESIRARTMRLAGIFPSENPQTSPERVVDACEEFIKEYMTISRLTAEDIAKIAADAGKNPMKLASAPRSISPDEAERILKGILSGL